MRRSLLIIGSLILGIFLGAVMWHGIAPIQYIEVSPSGLEGKDKLIFYVSVLKNKGYIVTEKELAVNDYTIVTFKEFLWILEESNQTECYVDYGGMGFILPRAMKLWVQLDGIYWEVRIK